MPPFFLRRCSGHLQVAIRVLALTRPDRRHFFSHHSGAPKSSRVANNTISSHFGAYF